jgi:hypothetical protein
MELLSGLVFGAMFGFLLQRGHILRYEMQLNMLRLKDMTVLKYFLSAAVVGMVGLLALKSIMFVELLTRSVFVGPIVVGGLVYGVGWAIVGYCPGTQLGAIGEGRWDALWAFFGAWTGAVAYFWIHPICLAYIYPIGHLGKWNLDVGLGLNPWIIVAVLGVAFALICWWLERRGL